MLNLSQLKTPGVYIDEVPKFPPSIAAVETAIPAFVGYTEKHTGIVPIVKRVTSLLEYEQYFGRTPVETFVIDIKEDLTGVRTFTIATSPGKAIKYRLYYAMQMFFSNGGGPCYIVSVGDHTATVDDAKLKSGLDELEKVDEVTILLSPDAVSLDATEYGVWVNDMLIQCNKLQDRFAIADVSDQNTDDASVTANFRGKVSEANKTDFAKYGAAYYPWLETTLTFNVLNPDGTSKVSVGTYKKRNPAEDDPLDAAFYIDEPAFTGKTLAQVKAANNSLYNQILALVNQQRVVLPPSSAVAGIYAQVDATRGVWKAPANVGLNRVVGPTVAVTHEFNGALNVTDTGKSVNVIRSFTGKGTLVWGARTLAGNDNEWRYVNVRRFFNFVEESTKKGTERFVFEPNDANTWIKVKAMIENFLILQWRAGALQGAKPEHAFYVKVGLNETMSPDDILNGRLIVEIGMAAVRPAEFIVLRFMHKLPES